MDVPLIMPNFVKPLFHFKQAGGHPQRNLAGQDVWPRTDPTATFDGVQLDADGTFTMDGWMDVLGDSSNYTIGGSADYKLTPGQSLLRFTVTLATDQFTLKKGESHTDKTVTNINGSVDIGMILGAILEIQVPGKAIVIGASQETTDQTLRDTSTERKVRFLTGGLTIVQTQ
jgi:hypothetical protein